MQDKPVEKADSSPDYDPADEEAETLKLLEEKTQYQKRAILLKNFTLQSRQQGTNIAQLAIPMFGLVLMRFLMEGVL